LLKPGGKLFARMAGTLNTDKIRPDAKEKLEKEIKHFIEHRTRPVPGYIPNTRAIVADPSDENPKNNGNLSTKHKFVFDKDVTQILLESDGFKIELCEYNLADTRKRLLLIAQKPHN
jgi:hypothetical protein